MVKEHFKSEEIQSWGVKKYFVEVPLYKFNYLLFYWTHEIYV
jgi:hypothetical protein